MSFKMLVLVFSTLFVICSCEFNANDLINTTINELELEFLEIVQELSKNEQKQMLYASLNLGIINQKILEYYDLNEEIQETASVPLINCIINANHNIGNYQNSLISSCFVEDVFKDDIAKLQEQIWEVSIVPRACKRDENCIKEKIENLKNDWDRFYGEVLENIGNFQNATLECMDQAVPMSIQNIEQAEKALKECLKN